MPSRIQLEKIIPPPPRDPAAVQALAKDLNVPEIIASLLLLRDLGSAEKASAFFDPKLSGLHSPFLFPDMEKAVERILTALREKEKICIYGDYDVDGITAIALLYRYLQSLNADVFHYIPDRLKEGYGLSETGIRWIHGQGARLIVTVDCGITADKEAALISGLDMDLIITDHHLPLETLPRALALINPKLPGTYPDQELSGVGVAFKLAQAIQERLQQGQNAADNGAIMEYLDLVSIGTLADIVPVIGENRILIKSGLRNLKKSACEGVKALLLTTGLYDKDIQASHVAFSLAPLINAAGRMGDPELALTLFTTPDPGKAQEAAKKLLACNEQRKRLDQSITEQCCRMIDEKIDLSRTFFLVLSSEGWHAGVMGIVASRLLEKYCRPVLMLSIENGSAKGSARSVGDFHILEAIQSCADLLSDFGGHKQAAGLELKRENIPALSQRLNARAESHFSQADFVPVVRTDLTIEDLDGLNWDVMHALKKFEPFGQKNARPLFYAPDLAVVGGARIVGNNHLKFRVARERVSFDAVAFRMGHRLSDVSRPGKRVTLAFHAEENEWNGDRTIQLNVRGIE